MGASANIDFAFYLALFRRRLPLFLLVLLASGALFGVATTFWPVSFQASARILVESPQIPTDLAKSTVPTGAAEQFQIIQEDVLSRRSMLDLAKRFNLNAGKPLLTDTDVIADMMTRLSIVPIPIGTGSGTTATVFQISFKADRPGTAADVVNDLVTMILKKDVELRTERARETVTFFNKETARLNTALRLVDGNILSFKNDNIASLPDSIDFRRTQQTNYQDRLLVLTQEEAGLHKREASLQFRPLSPTANPMTPDQQLLQSLQQSLVQQQAVFSETSPTIVALRRRISALEAGMLAADKSGGDPKLLASQNPELFDIRERLEEIANERTQLNQMLADITASIKAAPGIETTLNSLQRDHQNLQAQYDATVARLAEASTGQQIEVLLKGERLSLVESAVPPQKSQGPGKRALLLASALAALAMALAAVILPEFFNRRIRRPVELVARLQIAPFITVPYVERRSRSQIWVTRRVRNLKARLGFGSRQAAWSAPYSSSSRKRQGR